MGVVVSELDAITEKEADDIGAAKFEDEESHSFSLRNYPKQGSTSNLQNSIKMKE
jgi:hypothetical protein